MSGDINVGQAASIDKATIAVIIPAYNAMATLRATLGSIQNQSVQDLDIIVVDDGSTDDTVAIVREIAATDPRVRCISQFNSGQSAARNHGAQLSKAVYLSFCDADDIWHPTKLAKQLDTFHAYDCLGFVYCGFLRITLDDRVLSVHERFDKGDILARIMRRNMVGNGSTAMFSRSAFEDVGGFDERYAPAEDLAICLAVAGRYEVGVVSEPLVGYRIWDGSLSSNGLRVYRATKLLMSEAATWHPSLATAANLHTRAVLAWQIIRSLKNRKWTAAFELACEDYGLAMEILRTFVPGLAGKWLSRMVSPKVTDNRASMASLTEYWRARFG